MLTAAQIIAMRATATRALPDTAQLQRLTSTSDGGGGFTESWRNLDVVACRVAPLGGGEGGTPGGRVRDETSHVVSMAAGLDVTERDRLVIAGTTYEVTQVKRWGEWAITTRVEVKESAS